jgi:L-lactate dehydrogenase (cytochrome)/(S)-mandelate dehydrogenase
MSSDVSISEMGAYLNTASQAKVEPFQRDRRFVSVDNIRKLAKRKLPKMVFDFADGGSETEGTMRRNELAFSDLQLVPRPMNGSTRRDLSVDLFEDKLSMPVIVGPTGFAGLFWPHGEIASAKASHDAGTAYVMSHASTVTIENLAKQVSGPLWFQNFIYKDRGLTRSFASRAATSGYSVMVVTIDNQVPGFRERDVHNGFVVPPRLTTRNAADVLFHPGWIRRMLQTPNVTFANYASAEQSSMMALSAYMASNLDPDIRWSDFDDVRRDWSGKLVVKGVLHPLDAIEAIERGADAIIVSNHGGRQLDGSPATIDALPAVVEAVAGRVPVLLDGGVRRGADVVRARALGATACLIGRPQLWGLAVAGEYGVRQVLEIYRAEIDRVMALCGWETISDIDPTCLKRASNGHLKFD